MIFFNRLETSKSVTSRVSQTPPFTRLEEALQKSQGVECRRFLSLPSHFASSPIVFFFVLDSPFAGLNLLLHDESEKNIRVLVLG